MTIIVWTQKLYNVD